MEGWFQTWNGPIGRDIEHADARDRR